MSSISERDLREEPDGEAPGPRARVWLRRLAPLTLLAGAALAGGVLFERLPKEREIEVRLEDAATVVQFDLTWTDGPSGRGDADGMPVQGSTWRFAEGAAPRSLRTKVRLPDGSYDVQIGVDRAVGRDITRRTITLGDTDRLTLPVR